MDNGITANNGIISPIQDYQRKDATWDGGVSKPGSKGVRVGKNRAKWIYFLFLSPLFGIGLLSVALGGSMGAMVDGVASPPHSSWTAMEDGVMELDSSNYHFHPWATSGEHSISTSLTKGGDTLAEIQTPEGIYSATTGNKGVEFHENTEGTGLKDSSSLSKEDYHRLIIAANS